MIFIKIQTQTVQKKFHLDTFQSSSPESGHSPVLLQDPECSLHLYWPLPAEPFSFFGFQVFICFSLQLFHHHILSDSSVSAKAAALSPAFTSFTVAFFRIYLTDMEIPSTCPRYIVPFILIQDPFESLMAEYFIVGQVKKPTVCTAQGFQLPEGDVLSGCHVWEKDDPEQHHDRESWNCSIWPERSIWQDWSFLSLPGKSEQGHQIGFGLVHPARVILVRRTDNGYNSVVCFLAQTIHTAKGRSADKLSCPLCFYLG